MFQYAKARATFERYLAEGGAAIPDARRAEVAAEIATLSERTARLTIEIAEPGAEVRIDDEPVGRGAVRDLLVDAGTRRVSISSPGFAAFTENVVLAGGDTRTMRVDLHRLPPTLPASTPRDGRE